MPVLPSSNTAIGNVGTQSPTTTPNKQPSADEVLDLLNAPDDTPEGTPTLRAPKEGKDDDEIKLKEDDDEEKLKLDEEDDEDKDKDKDKKKTKGKEEGEETEEELDIDAPPKKRELLAKYPDIFKNFPWFEKMIYRDRQWTELFGSYDDAKVIAEDAQILQKFETELMGGSIEGTLKAVKENDPKAWDKIVDSYLTSIAKVDKDAYVEICGNIGKHIIHDIAKEARSLLNSGAKEQGELLQQVALNLNQYLFGSSQYTPPKPRVEGRVNEEEERINEERSAYNRERYENARDDLQTRVDNTLRATIAEYIDRNNEMSPYVKRNAINDAMKILHNAIGNDVAFRKNQDKLWEAAINGRFNQNLLNQIKSSYLGKGKSLLKAVIAKARAEALKDNVPSRREEEQEEEESRPTRRGPITTGRPRQSTGKNERKAGESVSEFFARD